MAEKISGYSVQDKASKFYNDLNNNNNKSFSTGMSGMGYSLLRNGSSLSTISSYSSSVNNSVSLYSSANNVENNMTTNEILYELYYIELLKIPSNELDKEAKEFMEAYKPIYEAKQEYIANLKELENEKQNYYNIKNSPEFINSAAATTLELEESKNRIYILESSIAMYEISKDLPNKSSDVLISERDKLQSQLEGVSEVERIKLNAKIDVYNSIIPHKEYAENKDKLTNLYFDSNADPNKIKALELECESYELLYCVDTVNKPIVDLINERNSLQIEYDSYKNKGYNNELTDALLEKIEIYNYFIHKHNDYSLWVQKGKDLSKKLSVDGLNILPEEYWKDEPLPVGLIGDDWMYNKYLSGKYDSVLDEYYFILATSGGLNSGVENGKKFLKNYEQYVNNEWGKELGANLIKGYENAGFLGKLFRTVTYGFGDGIAGFFSSINGNDVISGSEIAANKFGAHLASQDGFWNKMAYYTYSTNKVLGHQLPIVTFSAPFSVGTGAMQATTTLGKIGFGIKTNLVSSTLIYSSSYGNAYKYARAYGYSEEEASRYASANALTETLLEKFLSSTPGIGVNPVSVSPSVKNTLTNILISKLKDAGGEILENKFSDLAANIFLNQDNNLSIFEYDANGNIVGVKEEDIDTLFISLMSSSIMETPSLMIDSFDVKTRQDILLGHIQMNVGEKYSYDSIIDMANNGNIDLLYDALNHMHPSIKRQYLDFIGSNTINNLVSNMDNEQINNFLVGLDTELLKDILTEDNYNKIFNVKNVTKEAVSDDNNIILNGAGFKALKDKDPLNSGFMMGMDLGFDNNLPKVETIETKSKKLIRALDSDISNVAKAEILSNQEVLDYIVNNTSRKSFDKIMQKLDNPSDIIQMRKDVEQQVLNNIKNIDKGKAKDFISQTYLGDKAENILLTIETILERIDSDVSFKEKFSVDEIDFLITMEVHLKSDNLDADLLLSDINAFQSKIGNFSSFIYDSFMLARTDFRNEVQNSLEKSDIIDGVAPTIVKSTNGKTVNFYTLKGQTNNQIDFSLLVKTTDIREYMTQGNARTAYADSMKNIDYMSYSLINGEIYSLYSAKNKKVIFGYKSLGTNDLLSANTFDGQTKQYGISSEVMAVKKQQYLGLDTFYAKTDNYNEIVLKNNDVLMPDYIIVNESNPSQEIIDIASNMNIPIIYMDPAYYNKHTEYKSNDKTSYDNIDSINYSLEELVDISSLYDTLTNKKLIDPSALSLDDILTIFKKDAVVNYNGQNLNISHEEAIRLTMLELCKIGSGNGKSVDELFNSLGIEIGEIPTKKLNTLESRVWYLANEKNIPYLLENYKRENPQATLRDQAIFCFNERNRLRRVSRDAMDNDILREYLDKTESHKSFDDFFDNKRLKILETEDVSSVTDDYVYQQIIDSSTSSRDFLNILLGINLN